MFSPLVVIVGKEHTYYIVRYIKRLLKATTNRKSVQVEFLQQSSGNVWIPIYDLDADMIPICSLRWLSEEKPY